MNELLQLPLKLGDFWYHEDNWYIALSTVILSVIILYPLCVYYSRKNEEDPNDLWACFGLLPFTFGLATPWIFGVLYYGIIPFLLIFGLSKWAAKLGEKSCQKQKDKIESQKLYEKFRKDLEDNDGRGIESLLTEARKTEARNLRK